jgi:DNA-directed RNA polymerase subunit RPC12/RpoP
MKSGMPDGVRARRWDVDPLATRRRRLSPGHMLLILCAGCGLRMADPSEPLSLFRCPACGDVIFGKIRPTGARLERRPLPAPRRVSR